jgi:energy-coupling factor transport system permease protein
MSQRFELYLAGDSWLHRMDPRAKLWLALAAGIVALLYKEIGVLAGLLILAHLFALSARIPFGRLGWLWTRLAPLLVMILILQPFFSQVPGPALFQAGPLRLSVAGILDAISFALRAAALAFIAAAFLLTTDPAQLVQGLVRLGLPYPWGLTVGLAIRYLPVTFSLFATVGEAQQARGWIVGQGNLLQRVRSYLPILVATIIAALRLSDNLGLALAARGLGYPATRTVLHDVHFTLVDGLAVVLTTLLLVACLVLRFGLGIGVEPW